MAAARIRKLPGTSSPAARAFSSVPGDLLGQPRQDMVGGAGRARAADDYHELEDRDLVTRRRDPADRRRHIVEASAAGAAELAATDAQLDLVEDDLLKALSPQERATLHALLARAVGAVSPAWGSAKCIVNGPSAEPPPCEC